MFFYLSQCQRRGNSGKHVKVNRIMAWQVWVEGQVQKANNNNSIKQFKLVHQFTDLSMNTKRITKKFTERTQTTETAQMNLHHDCSTLWKPSYPMLHRTFLWVRSSSLKIELNPLKEDYIHHLNGTCERQSSDSFHLQEFTTTPYNFKTSQQIVFRFLAWREEENSVSIKKCQDFFFFFFFFLRV